MTNSPFRTERESKEYLIAQIIAEAKRQSVPLTVVEGPDVLCV